MDQIGFAVKGLHVDLLSRDSNPLRRPVVGSFRPAQSSSPSNPLCCRGPSGPLPAKIFRFRPLGAPRFHSLPKPSSSAPCRSLSGRSGRPRPREKHESTTHSLPARSNRRPRPHKKYLGALFRPYFGTYNDPRHFSSPYHRKPIALTPPQGCVRVLPADTPLTATSSRLVASWPADSFQRRTKLDARTAATCQFAALSPLGWVAAPWRRLSTPAVRPSIDSGSATATTSCGSSAPAS